MPGLLPPRGQRPAWPPEPFDDKLPTHPLLIVDYQAVKAGEQEAIDTLYQACSNLGFFYLKNHGVDPEPVFEVGEDTFALPLDELMEFEQGDSGRSAGFKAAGVNNVDAHGNRDTAMFMNIAKDDAWHYPTVRQRTYPSTIQNEMATITKFVKTSDEVLLTLMTRLEAPLGLPAGTFAKLHDPEQLSGSECRIIRKPAEGETDHVDEGDKGGVKAASIGAHTDFGSFSLLFGRGCGGLQVLPPGKTEWEYIKPLEGHAVCNVGDTLSVYSGGIFKSNTHRVIPPPPPQHKYTRWSAVMFCRPNAEADLYPLINLSPKIAEAAATNPVMSQMEKGITAGGWYKRRIAGQRVKNGISWNLSRGTEHTPDKD